MYEAALTMARQTSDVAPEEIPGMLSELVVLAQNMANQQRANARAVQLVEEWDRQGTQIDATRESRFRFALRGLLQAEQYAAAEALAKRLQAYAAGVPDYAPADEVHRLTAAAYYGQARLAEGDKEMYPPARTNIVPRQRSPMEDIEAKLASLYGKGQAPQAIALGEKQIDVALNELLDVETALATPPADPKAVAALRRKSNSLKLQIATLQYQVGELQHAGRNYKMAEALYRKAKAYNDSNAVLRRLPGAQVNASLGMLLRSQGRFAEATALLREALEPLQDAFGDAHPDVVSCRAELLKAEAGNPR